MTSRHYARLRGISFVCDVCQKQIRDGDLAVIINDDDERLYFHRACEPEQYKEHTTTIR